MVVFFRQDGKKALHRLIDCNGHCACRVRQDVLMIGDNMSVGTDDGDDGSQRVLPRSERIPTQSPPA
jgi:hypothetical protein